MRINGKQVMVSRYFSLSLGDENILKLIVINILKLFNCIL